jgi:hypothetical protein
MNEKENSVCFDAWTINPVQRALETSGKIHSEKIEKLAHPRDSAELGPCDFWFFGRAKTALRDWTFVDADELLQALIDIFDGITFEELQSVFQNWIERLEWVIGHKGEYSIK